VCARTEKKPMSDSAKASGGRPRKTKVSKIATSKTTDATTKKTKGRPRSDKSTSADKQPSTEGVTKPKRHYKNKRANVLGLLNRNALKQKNRKGGKASEKDRDGVELPFDTVEELAVETGTLDPVKIAKKTAAHKLCKLILIHMANKRYGVPISPKNKILLESFSSLKLMGKSKKLSDDSKPDNQGFNSLMRSLTDEPTPVSKDAKQALEKVEERMTSAILEQAHAFMQSSGNQTIHQKHMDAQRFNAYGQKRCESLNFPWKGYDLLNDHAVTSVHLLEA